MLGILRCGNLLCKLQNLREISNYECVYLLIHDCCAAAEAHICFSELLHQLCMLAKIPA